MVGSAADPGVAAEEAAAGEARDGVTPPMRNARGRIFRNAIDVAPHVVQKVEFDLLTILAVSRGWGSCAWLWVRTQLLLTDARVNAAASETDAIDPCAESLADAAPAPCQSSSQACTLHRGNGC